MDKRQIISSFNKSTISENVNIQGDDVKQHKEINYNNIVDDAFTKLFEEIQKIYDDAKRKEAEFFAQQLQEAYNKKDKEKAKTLIEFLRQRVQDVAALMTIATTLGITF
ncbi:MAG: hypothetical protein CW346_11115 [Bacillaceae bacterium]|nr:hypothetical protein [Bacillaceae bacterium]